MVQKINFILNKETISTDINPCMVLLDFIRYEKHLSGTKEGCKEGDCGACTVLVGKFNNDGVEYKSINSCLTPIGNIIGHHVVTIEGINSNLLTPIQKEFVEEGASQCGFCTPGFIISLTGYFLNNSTYSFDDAVNTIGGNICRCTGYTSIKRAIQNVFDRMNDSSKGDNGSIKNLINNKLLPEYFRNIPSRLTELKKLELSEENIYPNKKLIMGGGTDLYVQKPDEVIKKDTFFHFYNNLDEILVKDNKCIIGGAATFENIKQSKIIQDHFPEIKNYLDLIASLPIRNSATIAGNIINASPIGDLTIFLLALNAKIILNNGKNKREIFLKDFYKGYKLLDKTENELLEQVIFEIPSGDYKYNFEKVSKRTYLDIASVNTAIYLKLDNDKIIDAHISAGGIAPIPLYMKETSSYLLTKQVNSQILKDCLNISQSEIYPITDVRGSAEYKRLLLNQLIKAHFIKLFPENIEIGALI